MPEQLSFAGLGAPSPLLHGVFFAIYPDAAAAARIARLTLQLAPATIASEACIA